ncbi:MAG: HD domain-containing protein [Clostridiales bacterium]|nr:HD domain-containing protein [Clostridiales bacterium]
MDKLRQFLTDFTSAIQAGKIYSIEHPRFKEFVGKSFQALQEIFQDQEELTVGVVEGEVACGKEIFFDLSQKLRPLLTYLEDRGVERVWLHRALREDEWTKFIGYLSLPRGQAIGDAYEYLTLEGIENIRAGKIEAPRAAAEKGPGSRARQYEFSVAALSQSVEKILAKEKLDPVEARFLVFSLLENFWGSHQELLSIFAVRQKDRLIFLHLLNTAILAMFFSSRLGFPRDEVLDIGLAGLFHDVGRLAQDRDDEARRLGHALLGAEMLLPQRESLGQLPAVVAFEHSFGCGLKSRSRLTFPRRPHPATLLISVCDIYDEMYQKRASREFFTPLRIYEVMARQKGSFFDPEYLDSFYRIMGVWPAGTIVSLADGRVAVVRKANSQDIFCPQVEVVDPPDRREWLDLAERKSEVAIQAALNPFGEGKKYLPFI